MRTLLAPEPLQLVYIIQLRTAIINKVWETNLFSTVMIQVLHDQGQLSFIKRRGNVQTAESLNTLLTIYFELVMWQSCEHFNDWFSKAQYHL